MVEPVTWIALVLVLPSWTLIHESSHATTSRAVAPQAPFQFAPYPHRHEGDFYWGALHYDVDATRSDQERAWIAAAPRMVDVVGIAGLVVAVRRRASQPLIAWLGGALGDLAFASIGGRGSDLDNLARTTPLSRGSWRALHIGVLVASIGTIIWAVRHPTRERRCSADSIAEGGAQ